MNSQVFLRLSKEAFAPFLKQLGFMMNVPSINGRFYCVDFSSENHQVSISYELGEKVLFVIIGESRNGKFVDIDDRIKTPHLADLNSRYMATITSEEHVENDSIFRAVTINDKEEYSLLKAVKELRLVLPKYLNEPYAPTK